MWHAKFLFIVQSQTLSPSFISWDEAWWPDGLKFQPASHSSTTQRHSVGSKSHWVFSSAPSLISFYGWRHRNSWLIWMTYPRISAWIYWYKNELNSYLKSTFSPATQQKQVIFFYKNVSFEIKSEKSCQVFNSKVFPAHSLQCLNLNNSMSRVFIGPFDPLFTDHLF